MKKHLLRRIIDYTFRRKSLFSILYICVAFFLRELATLGASEDIVELCNHFQNRNPDSWKFYGAQIVKIIFTDGSYIALISSGLLILFLLSLIYRGETIKESLDNLKSESKRASSEISTEVNKLKEVTSKLSYPKPSEFIATSLIVKIKSNGLKEFLPELRTNFNTVALLKENQGKEKYINTNFDLKVDSVNSSLKEVFDNKSIHLSLQIGDEKGPFINENRMLIWTFNANLSLKDKSTHLLYFVDFKNDETEYFKLIIESNSRFDINGKLRLFSGFQSALDLCGQRVHLGFQIGENQTLMAPLISIIHLAFRDNNSNDYYIEFDGITTKRHHFNHLKEINSSLNIPDYHDVNYLTGIIKCISI